MKKCLLSIFFFMLFHSAYGYEQIYYPEEEYSSRYIIKDYSYINNYNQLWQELSSKIDITYYDEFIYKNFGIYTSRILRDEVINFIKNYKIQTNITEMSAMVYPEINSLIMQNKALLKAREVLDNVPDHDKTSLVYLAAGLSYIYSDGLYELDKLKKIFKEWLRLGGDDFPEIKGEERQKRYKFFSYIANISENPSITKEFINILENGYYDKLIFEKGLFDIFNADFYTIISSREVYAGSNIIKYFVDYINAGYMDIITNKHFRLDIKGTKVNHYWTIWDYKKGQQLNKDNFYIFPFNKQTFILSMQDFEDKKIFQINYYNPQYIDTPYYAEITYSKIDKTFNGKTVWPYTLIRNQVVNRLVSSPSFVCRDNMTMQQNIICESFLLRMLDKISSRKYYLLYRDVKNNSKKSKELAKQKEKFLDSLNQCSIDRQCIQQEYKAYIDMLISFK